MSPRRDAPRDRRWRDPEGTRRASVEFGGKGPGRKPGGRRQTTSMRGHEGRGARLGRRLSAVGRFGRRHRGSLLCVAGSIGAAVSLIAFEGAVQLTSGLVSLAVLGAGAAVHHHQKTRTLHRSPNVYAPSWSERRDMERARRSGQFFDGTPHQQGRVTVHSHTRDGDAVKTHTRAAPGKGGGDQRAAS